ncbi:MAG TPA: mechanosensitive ion channel domain-containing protein [Terriglobales bacterium]|jgi:small-conductance mechanosensitive channel|nr:mechanosensitive ion channel domain-containing protein [Terriglobales bacterium]
MKTPQRVVLLALLLLLGAVVVGLELTRPSAPAITSSAKQRRNRRPRDLVDQQPLRTAQSLVAQISDREERRFAFRALRLADDEVDLAFATALRDAEAHPAAPTDEVRDLQKRLQEVQARLAEDQQTVKGLQAALQRKDDPDLQQQLDLAQAQLSLHQEDLADAKQDLVRAGGDLHASIKRALDEHEATHATITGSQAVPDVSQAAPESATLLSHLRGWRALRARQSLITAAQQEAAAAVAALTRAHDDLQQRLQQQRSLQPGSGIPAAPVQNTTAAITSMHRVAADVQTLADFGKRIQDEQDLADNYRDWAAVIAAHQMGSLHGMFLSGLWIVLIALGALAGYYAIGRFGAALTPDRRSLRSLQFILRFALQAVVLLLVLLVVFGAPSQMTFVLGLAGAGLTVALKDFIVAFFGWFVLMGKNGLRVGDWVEIKGIGGEVVEVGLLRTVLLETGQWSDSGHPTGRKVTFVNSFAIEGHFFNFSTTGQWLWDQLDILVPPGQEPYTIVEAVQGMVAQETEADARLAEQEWRRVVRSPALQSFSAAPAVDVRPTPLGVAVTVRYITRAHERHEVRNRLYHRVVELLQGKAIPAAPRPVTSTD